MQRQTDNNAPKPSGSGDGPKTVLPQNLAVSLRYLAEQDIMRLAEALAAEMDRRGLVAAKENNQAPRKVAPDPVLSELTRSQISLIQSSIKAGVKPAALSRQFGITRAQITAVLKAGA